MVRFPRYAGRYYFADPGRLRASVESFVEDAATSRVPGTLLAIIVPHGTHREFGPIAGYGYKLLLSIPLLAELTVLLAPADVADDTPAVLCDPSDAYATPLDLIGVATSAVDGLSRIGIPVLRRTDEEPVVESHLPFIQVVMGDTQFLPLRVPIGADVTSPDWQRAARGFGLIIAAANLPRLHEQAACDAVQRLDAQYFVGGGNLARSGGLKRLFGGGSRASNPADESADAAVLALAIHMARAKGADQGQLLAREGQRAAFALYRAS